MKSWKAVALAAGLSIASLALVDPASAMGGGGGGGGGAGGGGAGGGAAGGDGGRGGVHESPFLTAPATSGTNTGASPVLVPIDAGATKPTPGTKAPGG